MPDPRFPTLFQSVNFPQLTAERCRETSEADGAYNCIAWAFGDTRRWWWPSGLGGHYWPVPGVTLPTPSAFKEAFKQLGYEVISDSDFHPRRETIAIFVGSSGLVTHASRRTSTGWTSKLGGLWTLNIARWMLSQVVCTDR